MVLCAVSWRTSVFSSSGLEEVFTTRRDSFVVRSSSRSCCCLADRAAAPARPAATFFGSFFLAVGVISFSPGSVTLSTGDGSICGFSTCGFSISRFSIVTCITSGASMFKLAVLRSCQPGGERS